MARPERPTPDSESTASTAHYSSVGLEVVESGGTLRLTLDRPGKRNALSKAMLEELHRIVGAAAQAVPRVLVVSAVGATFCAGGDLSEMSALVGTPQEVIEQRARLAAEIVQRIATFPMPTVAAVQGYAVGGGACIALACDRIVAADDAVFDFPFARLGSAGCDMLAPAMLSRRIGTAKALQLLLDGARLPAQEARVRGLIDEVVPTAELNARRDELVQRWAGGRPGATRATKAAILALERSTGDLSAQLALEARLTATVLNEGPPLEPALGRTEQAVNPAISHRGEQP